MLRASRSDSDKATILQPTVLNNSIALFVSCLLQEELLARFDLNIVSNQIYIDRELIEQET